MKNYTASTTAVLYFECDIEVYGGSMSRCFVHRRPINTPFDIPSNRHPFYKDELQKELEDIAFGTFVGTTWNKVVNNMSNKEFPSIEGCAFSLIWISGDKQEYISTKDFPFKDEILSIKGSSIPELISVKEFCELYKPWSQENNC